MNHSTITKWPNLWPPTEETIKQFENAERTSTTITEDQRQQTTDLKNPTSDRTKNQRTR